MLVPTLMLMLASGIERMGRLLVEVLRCMQVSRRQVLVADHGIETCDVLVFGIRGLERWVRMKLVRRNGCWEAPLMDRLGWNEEEMNVRRGVVLLGNDCHRGLELAMMVGLVI